jgi:hypothetical protein
MLTYFVYAPLLIQIGALSLDVIWDFQTTSSKYLISCRSKMCEYVIGIFLKLHQTINEYLLLH